MAKKIINVGDRNVVIRLVKKTDANVTFSQGVAPQNAINNATELSFKLTNKPPTENRFVIGTFDTPNIKNPNLYITNGSAYDVQDGNMLNVNVPITLTDPNYINRIVGLFLKFTPDELQYVLGDRVAQPNPKQFGVKYFDAGSLQPTTDVYTINTIVATRGVYFNDLNYYVPIYMGTLKHLEESWGVVGGTLGMLEWFSTGSSTIGLNLNVTHQIPVSSVAITNTTTNFTVGDSVDITYTVSPIDADIAGVTFSTNDPLKASFADPTIPTLTVNGPGNFTVTATATDILGNSVQTNKTFSADLNMQPLTMSFTVNAGEQISITAASGIDGTVAKYEWGDGTATGYTSVNGTPTTHTFGSSGSYQVNLYVNQELDSLVIGKNTSMSGLRTVNFWGDVIAKTISFRNCTNLTSVPSQMCPGQIDLTEMFYGCTSFNQDISAWDVSAIANFTNMFYGATAFNQPLNSWITSSAIDLSGMFYGASSFNQPIGGWDVDQVTNFAHMFDGATAFNKSINSWQTTSATNMSGMFRNASTFNQPIGAWAVDYVTDMSSMFQGTSQATIFNQDISAWNVSSVTNMNAMFKGNIAFNQNLRYWCVSDIATRPIDFTGIGTPIATINEPRWGLCPIRNVAVTIVGLIEPVRINDVRALSYTLNPDTPVQSAVWSSSNENIAVIDESGNAIFTDVGEVTISISVNGLYTGSKTLTVQDVIQPMAILSTGLTSGVVNVGTDSLTGVTVDWGDGSAVDTVINDIVEHTFTGTDKRVIRIMPIDSLLMPSLHVGGEIEEVVKWYPNTHTGELHLGSVSGSKLVRVPSTAPLVENMSNMFADCNLFNQNIGGWNMSNVTNTSQMFKGCSTFNQDIGSWNVGNVTNMDGMFDGATVFNRDLAWWCVTNILAEPSQFANNSALTTNRYPTWGTCPSRSYVLTIDPVSDIDVGSTAQLTYTLSPTITINHMEWSTDNASVATVDSNGLVTGVNIGTTTINVKLNHVFIGSVSVTVQGQSIINEPTSFDMHRVISPTQVSGVVSSS